MIDEKELDLTKSGQDPLPKSGTGSGGPPPITLVPFNADEAREKTRGDLARGLLWLLTFAVGGVLAFIGLGRLEGSVLSQSIFPSLIALAGTALGFYFGSQTSSGTSASVGAASPPSPHGPPMPPATPTSPPELAAPVEPAPPPETAAPVEPVPPPELAAPVEPAPPPGQP